MLSNICYAPNTTVASFDGTRWLLLDRTLSHEASRKRNKEFGQSIQKADVDQNTYVANKHMCFCCEHNNNIVN